jgi:lipopolysaccharide exporter
MGDNLTSKTFRGLNWTYLSTIVNSVLQIGFTAVLARLLDPAAFGLVAMAGIILRFGGYFAQMGVGSALIQRETLTDEDVRAAFTSSALLGLVFAGLTCVLAPLGLYIFDSPHVVPVIRAMGFSFLLTGLSTTALSMLKRRLNFRSLAIIEISSYVLGYGAVGILLALMGLGVWSLVVASLSQAGLVVVLAYLFVRHSVSPSLHLPTHKKLISFGGRLSVISFLEFIGFNVDTLVIGRTWGASSLGIYTRSFALVNLPVQYIATAIPKVLFPSFSQVQKEPDRLRNAYYTGQMLVALVALPLSFAMIPAAKEIVLTLLGSQWVSGVIILQILAVLVPFNMGTILPGVVCDSTGRLNPKFFLQFAFVALVILLIGLVYRYGVQAIAMTVVVANIIRFLAYQVLMWRMISISYSDILKAHAPGLFVTVAVVLGIILLRWVLQDLPVGALLLAEVVVGGAIFLSLVLAKPPALLKNVLCQTLSKLEGNSQGGWADRSLIRWYRKKVLCA